MSVRDDHTPGPGVWSVGSLTDLFSSSPPSSPFAPRFSLARLSRRDSSSNTRRNGIGRERRRIAPSYRACRRDQRQRETTKIATGWLARTRGYGVRVRLPWSPKIYATGGEIRLSPDRPKRLWSRLASLFSQEATYWIVHVIGSRRFSLRRSSYPREEAIETIYAPTICEMSP